MGVVRFVCVADGCDFCDNDEENAERHSEGYGDKHDLLRIEFDPYAKKITKANLIDNNSVSVI